ncbi:hypothetical protein AOZ06_07705 [Kibdelosporangium phytohabitans]|uniref:Uncharacterized protein n=2 Tax=Kibdelosporangium phytohabitans TaxID=860235 RepID=A0A0N9HL71_9PSEU|nr:hypothetical protein AOZ06_07705 [Kibdelosporangium phytohabitans]
MTDESAPDTKAETPTEPQEFIAFLLAVNKGRSEKELTAALQKLVEAVQESRKGGKLTYTLNIAPSKADGAVNVTDSIAVKAPTLDRPTSIFFIDEAHNLVRNPANQNVLPFDH